MKSQPLTDTELDQLSAILARFGDERSMNLEQLDGFLAALICGPELVPPSKYVPEIWGDQTVFEDASSAQAFMSLLMRHWNSIANTLNSGEAYLPLLLEDESGIAHGNDWANGFLRGMEFGKEDWTLLLEDEEYGGSLVAILALANEHNSDPKMRPYKDPISTELRETLITGAAASTMQVYRYFKAQRFLHNNPLGNMPTSRRTMPKIGRNDPCPCGSGKKASSAVERPLCIRPLMQMSKQLCVSELTRSKHFGLPIHHSIRMEAHRVRQGKVTAIVVLSHDKLPAIIDTLIAAVRNGELDGHLDKVSKVNSVKDRKAT